MCQAAIFATVIIEAALTMLKCLLKVIKTIMSADELFDYC